MKNELIKMLSSMPSLSEGEAKEIADNITIQTYKKGTILLKEGAISKECYSVLKGCVREYYIKDGEEKTTAFFTEGQEVVSFTSYTNQTPSKHYLSCVEESTLTVSSPEKEKEMYKRFPKLEVITRTMMELNSGMAQEELASFITSSPEEQYMNLLENRSDLLNRVPQHQIASYLGIKPESLSRIRKRIVSKF
ncbi:MAG: Crp/Fnr family transcriptional regulator [Bacteroidetes bacterium]|nr:Crp/Fnr family transcriptional regulator [Bacteroidota bacterium]